MKVWILTFNRRTALNRQIKFFGELGYDVCVFTNYPTVHINDDNTQYVKKILINTLGDKDCFAWAARSWNNMFIKCFDTEDEAIFVQDDTPILPNIKYIIENNKDKYDLIWGPGGDSVFYLKKSLLAKVGWWDERYYGAYCCDADFLVRCWLNYDQSRLSIEEVWHSWGWIHNPVGMSQIVNIPGRYGNDDDYENQHDQIIKLVGYENFPMVSSQKLFKQKWNTPGNGIDNIGPLIYHITQPVEEIDWYHWFTVKYLR